jgi:hypothetical protein
VIDRGIGLNVFIEGGIHDVAIERADDSCANRHAEAQGVTDRQNWLTDPKPVAVGEFQKWQGMT